MNYLLDTNIVSELGKPAPDTNCIAWLSASSSKCHLSSITLAELRYGIERLPESKRKSGAESDFQHLIRDYRDKIFDFDPPAAFEWGRYAAELEAMYGSDWWKHFDFRDTQIGAIAREYGMTVATRNVKHFPFCQTVNPFDSKHSPSQPTS